MCMKERKRRDRTQTETANLLFSAQGLFVHMAAPLIAGTRARELVSAFIFLTNAKKKKKKICLVKSARPVFALFNEKPAIPTPIVNLTRPTVAAL